MKIREKESLYEDVEAGGWKFSNEYGILTSPEGKPLVLEPRLSKLLYLLCQNVNAIVSRDYLIENIWKDSIVNEGSLTRAIADLRKILSNNFNSAIKIDTIPKRGYKLVLQAEHRKYILKLKINSRSRYAILGLVLFLLTLLWIANY